MTERERTEREPAAATERLIAGLQPVREAVRAHGGAVARVYVLSDGGTRIEGLARFAADQGVTVERVAAERLDALGGGVRHQGVLAFAPPLRMVELESLHLEHDALVLVLDGITDPQNFGATIRSAVAFGTTAVVWAESHSAPLTPATFRASAGAVEHATLCRVRSLRDAIAWLAARDVHCLALDGSAPVSLQEIDLAGPCAFVVGSEDRGVGKSVRAACAGLVRVPMSRGIDSLNASVAAALALYEARRQRTAKNPS